MTRRYRTYLSDALDVIERSALFSTYLDWDAIRREAEPVADAATQYSDMHDFLDGVLARAGGEHSGLNRGGQRRVLSDEEREVLGPPAPTGHVIDAAGGPVAYLRLPRTDRTDERGARYLSAGSEVIKMLTSAAASAPPRGWVVDLRANVGGNMWPMLAVASPLLPGGVLGYFEYRDGTYKTFGLRAGTALHGDFPMASLGTFEQLPIVAPTPIAVLVSRYTMSAGEAVALAFRAEPRARLIGSPTRGLTTGNIARPLRDGTIMRVTTSYYADWQRIRCVGPLPVDQDLTGQSRSAVLDAAVSWILEG